MVRFLKEYKDYIISALAIFAAFVLVGFREFKLAAAFWALFNLVFLLYKRSFEWLVYLILASVLLFPTGGDFKESRLLTFPPFPVTVEKLMVLVAGIYVMSFGVVRGSLLSIKHLVSTNLELKLMLLFSFVGVLSVLFSPVEVERMRLALFLLSFLLYFAVAYGPLKVEVFGNMLAFFVFFTVTVVGGYALVEFILRSNLFEGAAGFKPFATGELYRVKSTQGIPLVVSSLLSMVLPFLLPYFWLRLKKTWVYLLFIPAFFIISLGQLVTFTRTGWVVYFLELVLVIVIFRHYVFRFVIGLFQDYPKATYTFLFFSLASLIYVFGLDIPRFVGYRTVSNLPVLGRLALFFYDSEDIPSGGYAEVNTITVSSRSEGFIMGLRIAYDRPLTGVGLGGFSKAVPLYGSDLEALNLKPAPDSTYTALLAETGLFGTAIFLSLLVFVIFRLLSFASSDSDKFRKSIYLSTFIAGLGVLVQSVGFEVFNYAHSAFVFWMLAGVSRGLKRNS